MNNTVDVLIAGMGPTGATLAALLGQRGISVAIFDRLPDLYPLPRAIGMDHEVMRTMQGLGLAEKLRPITAPYRPSTYLGVQGQVINRLDAAPPPYRLGWHPNYVFDQPALERLLRSRLAELPSVRMECSAEIVDTGQDESGAWADIRLLDGGNTERLHCKYLIACDGGASPIRKRLGIELEDLQFDEPWLVVDTIVSDEKAAELPDTQVQYCEPDRPATYVIGVGNHRRWEIMLLPGDSISPDFPEDELWPLLSRWLKPGEGKLWRSATYRFHGLVAYQWRCGRILLAGDAAHMTPPFMAQGMVQGIRDANNLAWKLSRVCRNASPDSLLDSYSIERRPHVMATTRAAIQLGRVICERDHDAATIRDELAIRDNGGRMTTTIRQNLIPGLKEGLIAAETPGAGEIFPQPMIAETNHKLDDIAGSGIRFVVAGPLLPDEEDVVLAQLAPLGGRLIHLGDAARSSHVLRISENEPVVRPWLDQLGRRVAIVRPDHYVFGTARSVREGLAILTRLTDALSISQ